MFFFLVSEKCGIAILWSKCLGNKEKFLRGKYWEKKYGPV